MTRTAVLYITAATAALAGPALAQDGARISQLEARIAQLEAAQSGGSGPTLTFGAGTVTKVEFYGYIQTDFIADFGAELGDTTFPLAALTSDDDGTFFNATVRETRLGFRTTTPSAFGELGTQVEIDFYGSDQIEPRLRHATATLGGFRVGQYWTTFMPIASYPVTLDFQGVAGIPFARQEMIRYTYDAGAFVGEVAIEESNADSDDPVLIATAAYDTDPLLVKLAALYGTVNAPDGTETNVHGFNLSATAKPREGGTIDASYTNGDGIASYMVFGGNNLNADGDAIGLQSAYISLSQAVNDKLTLRAIYGWRDNDEGADEDFETLTSVHLNAQYQLLENTLVGLEYVHGTVDRFSGATYEVDRLQASVQIDF